MNKLLQPLKWAVARDPGVRYRAAHVIQQDKFPLLWLLGDWPHITWGDHDDAPEPLDAEWLLVDASARDRVESGLKQSYFRERVHLRGMAPDDSFLYLRATTFGDYFAGRAPEVQPSPRVWKLEPETDR